MVLAFGNAPTSIGYQPIALLLSYTRKMAESGGLAPQPTNRSSCFRNSVRALADSLSITFGGEQWFCPTDPEVRAGFQPVAALRGFTLQILAEARGHAPQRHEVALTASNGCRHACPVSPPKVSATGFAPAWVRLEGGGLSFSATRRKGFCDELLIRNNTIGPCGGNPTRNDAFEARHDNNFTTQS